LKNAPINYEQVALGKIVAVKAYGNTIFWILFNTPF